MKKKLLILLTVFVAAPFAMACGLPKKSEKFELVPHPFKLFMCLGYKDEEPADVVQELNEQTKEKYTFQQQQGLLNGLQVVAKEISERKDEDFYTDIWDNLDVEIRQMQERATKALQSQNIDEWRAATRSIVASKWKNSADQITINGAPYNLYEMVPRCLPGQHCPKFLNWSAVVRVTNMLARLDAYSEFHALEEMMDYLKSKGN